ncbi:MAG: hypothetical protein OJI67_03470, partial [Prosthecobacter sp.]|nr:hypothetical protein [Prosthecobacter sp.]
HETSHIFDQFCWHSGKPNVEPASDAQQKRGLLVPALCYSQAISNLVGGFSTLIQLIIFTT